MVLRFAALGLPVGLAVVLAGSSSALAEVSPEAPSVAAICQRSATFQTLPADSLLNLAESHQRVLIYKREIGDPFQSVEKTMKDVENSPSPRPSMTALVVAEQSAALPEAARDLPLLIILSGFEESSNPLSVLMLSPDSVLFPDILAMLERREMSDTLRAFRLAQAAMPVEAALPEDWAAVFSNTQTTPEAEVARATARAGLEAADRVYPTVSARKEAIALVDSDPQIRAALLASITDLDDGVGLGWLLWELDQKCTATAYSAVEADQNFAALGTPQAAILLLDKLLETMAYGDSAYYFTDIDGIMAPATARVLDIRGLAAEADALRTGMALIGTPYPRDPWEREGIVDSLTEDQIAQLDALAGAFDPDVLWNEMTLIAVEADLIPRAAP